MDKLTKSPRLNFLLGEIDIFTPYQVIEHLPRKYEDFSLTKERGLSDKEKVTIFAKIVSNPLLNSFSKAKLVSFDVKTEPGNTFFRVNAFNRPYLLKTLKTGDLVTATGTYDKKNNVINLITYHNGKIDSSNVLKANYSLPAGITNYQFSSLVKRNLETLKGKIFPLVPYAFINKYKLVNKETALQYAHFPSSISDIKQAHRYLKYEEALMFSLKNQIIRHDNKLLSKIKKEPIDLSLTQDLINSLPYKLTDDQLKAATEIIEDMNQPTLMYRLLQGDVGTGKTIVCFLALYANYKRGDQGALMAPTDALARQHYQNAVTTFKSTKVKIALLVGSTSTKEKEQIYRDLEDGSIDIIIGTHALFTKSIKYSKLGLAIIDEQHRFGVNQRMALSSKGKDADLLMLSATPIPRSLALSIYGDLDVSTLTLFPNRTRNVKTIMLPSTSERIFKAVDNCLAAGKKIFVVAPKISLRNEDNASAEELFKLYSSKYGEKVGLLHGKINKNGKESVLDNFVNGKTPILVSTQVIEVGIDVKDAALMIIYEANNFGLASLHQLRGRVGRDGSPSMCILTYENIDDDQKKRLEVIVNNNDGFVIAEQDLKSRGPGELTGIKQSGIPNFKYLNIIDDIKIFECARDDAKEILSNRNDKKYSYIISRAEKEVIYEPIINA